MKEKQVNEIANSARVDGLIKSAIKTAAPRPFVEKYATLHAVSKAGSFIFGGVSALSAGGGFYLILSSTQNVYAAAAAAIALAGMLEAFKGATLPASAIHFAGGEKTNGVILFFAAALCAASPVTSFLGAGELTAPPAALQIASDAKSEKLLLVESKKLILEKGDPKSGRTKTAVQNLDAQIKIAEEKESAQAAEEKNQKAAAAQAAEERNSKLQIWSLIIVGLSELLYIVAQFFIAWYSVRVARAHAPQLFEDNDTPPPARNPIPTENAPTYQEHPSATQQGGQAAPPDAEAHLFDYLQQYAKGEKP